ncbi:MAG: SOS response-associated peptidase [Bacilli bacterium]|jgi:putative SOS response-associated peptidase YedK|nr:SOS response-associated peptidase [Bacilli bacterium]
MCRHFSIEPDESGHLEVYPGLVVSIKAKQDVFPMTPATGLIYLDKNTLALGSFSFGLPGNEEPFLNARSETVLEKPFYRESYLSSRAVFPCTSFFELDRNQHEKEFFPQEKLFYLAGFTQNGHFVLLTEKAGEDVSFFHKRMPLALRKEDILPYLKKAWRSEEFQTRQKPLFQADKAETQLSLF